MPVPSLPNALADGTLALGSEVRANDDAIVSVLDHGLTRDNFPNSGANIPATILSTTAGERVPTNRIEDDAVDKDKLKDDATAGSPNAAVNTANHIKDGIITAAKLAAPLPGGGIGANRLRIFRTTVGLTMTIGAGSSGAISFATIGGFSPSAIYVLCAAISRPGLSLPPSILQLAANVIEYPSGSGSDPLWIRIHNSGFSSIDCAAVGVSLTVTYIAVSSS